MHREQTSAEPAAGEQALKLTTLNALAGKIAPPRAATAAAADAKNRPAPEDGTQLGNGRVPNGLARDQPDSDAIKMFVGQVPRHMNENDIRGMFEEFGPVHQINVLRDKVTGHSKGCCFVTFYTRKAALHAQNELHNIKTLPGMHHAIQMKPADTENRNERKLFIGMLSKKYNENDVREMFQSFGAIEECTVLRDQSGVSKGCAFVTFGCRQYAIAAIKSMHQTQTMEGCSSPLTVKFADTQKEKDAKRLQNVAPALWGSTSAVSTVGVNPQYLALLQQLHGSGMMSPAPMVGLGAIPPSQFLSASLQNGHAGLAGMSGLQSGSGMMLGPAGEGTDLGSHGMPPPFPGNMPDLGSVGLASLAAMNANCMTVQGLPCAGFSVTMSVASVKCHRSADTHVATRPPGQTSAASPVLAVTSLGLPSGSPAPLTGLDGVGSYSALQQYTGYPAYTPPALAAANNASGRQAEGPDGCNLFIYHLPQEFADSDLAQSFLPFGNVISAKVFVDKQTNLSKCFGFVSYNNPSSSQAAIHAMNGFQIGTKRLKVQLKRSRDASKPY